MKFLSLLIALSNVASFRNNGSNELPSKYLTVCGDIWQSQYTKYHKLAMTLKGGDLDNINYIVSVPICSGLADIVLGYITAFLISLISNRIFYILDVDVMKDSERGETHKSIDFAYYSPNINWTFPLYLNKSMYSCLMPPYQGNKNSCLQSTINNNNVISINDKDYSIKHIPAIGKFITSIRNDNLSEWENVNQQLLLIANNRGHTLDIFHNPYHNDTIISRYKMNKDTLFPCLFHYLFRLKPDVCTGLCKVTENLLIKYSYNNNNNSKQNTRKYLTIGIQTRRQRGENHFKCADEIINDLKSYGISVYILYITAKSDDQLYYKEKYGDMLLLPLGEPMSVETMNEYFNGSRRNEQKIISFIKWKVEGAVGDIVH